MTKRTAFEARIQKHKAMNEAEAAGIVADSHEARMIIVDRIKKGEITLKQGQAELKRIQREAKKNGKITRRQAFSQG